MPVLPAANLVQARLLKIYFQNINGWIGKKTALKYDIGKLNPDVVLLAHTNIFERSKPLKFYPYVVYTHNTGRHHSGVAILIKPDIQHSIIKKRFDGDTLAIKIETSMGPIVVGVNYTPPARFGLPHNDLRWFERHQFPAYLLGDLNARHTSYDTSTNPFGQQLYDGWLRDGSLVRLGPDTGTFTSTAGNVTKPDSVLANRRQFHHAYTTTLTNERNVSDHAAILLELGDRPIRIPAKSHDTFERANWTAYENFLKTELPPINLNNKNIQEIDTLLEEIGTKTTAASNSFILKSKFTYTERNNATPKFHRQQNILAQL